MALLDNGPKAAQFTYYTKPNKSVRLDSAIQQHTTLCLIYKPIWYDIVEQYHKCCFYSIQQECKCDIDFIQLVIL